MVMTAMAQPCLEPSARTPDGPPSPMNRAVCQSGSSMRAGGRRRRPSAALWRDPDRPVLGTVGRVLHDLALIAAAICASVCVVEHAGLAQLLAEVRQRVAVPSPPPAPRPRGTWSAGRPTSAPVSRVTLASRSVGPRPPRARSMRRLRQPVAAQHVRAVQDDAGHVVAGAADGDVLAPPTRGDSARRSRSRCSRSRRSPAACGCRRSSSPRGRRPGCSSPRPCT